ncbi:MAG: ABC transporter substrate-binding protein [Verrucomicrobiae bacterium]|nr:ABC transporter substrate-binding protein [Verrucomicrobiae bacterium]
MVHILKRLSFGLGLIALASVVLLLSDLQQRRQSSVSTGGAVRHSPPRIAVFQFGTRVILDDCVRGVTNALAAAGFVNGKTVHCRFFNAEGDLPTANSIAKNIVDGGFDLVITASTPCLQIMAAANQAGSVTHVFGCVTDPFASGVGISRDNPLHHPKHLVGIGTFQPVKETFRLMKEIRPQTRTVGVVWCTSETCAEACVRLAREICSELGMTLIEAPVDSSSAVQEAAQALAARGLDAFWVGGDNVVEQSISAMIKAADDARVPLFVNSPALIQDGATIGLGADYYQVGQLTGQMAVSLLRGTDPASIRIENKVPRQLGINLGKLKKLRHPWNISDSLRKEAALICDENGTLKTCK